ncbi:HPr(Ser) kinase/phosphatase [Vagococcus intermedius]|uniref:HPr kinase/phosphorylase n=1 Tax=Vagococcus intermedius TaxID=2991418 RepID=A0AAF0CWG5_9ENTE|nr:HPr(Ser) kinase/phosphatase [Vagococcus intermedius]WEG74112.1 HPr(Ser) kinase/phosphatase [Vagococcus intermedius]WEG76192.1 HPr(Ser) kinase/phosphatase [Vagococcus intermedius]
MTEFVTVRTLVNELQLEVVCGENYLDKKIITSDISRPGLELTGYFNYYPHDRVQLFGRKESAFSEKMMPEERAMVMRRMCHKETPAIIYARGIEPPVELIEAAEERQTPILVSPLTTSRISGVISTFLESKLAKRTSIHGVLVEVYGLGVLIQGDSGIGKSETALELIKKGHRLIADDRVDVYQQDERTIIGEPARILEHLIEIRGIGIIDVMNLFGASAVRPHGQVQLVVYLENWSKDKQFDRLGGANETMQIANVDIPKISIPVKTGRNVAIIVEVAAMNFRAKTMGYDATKTFENNLSALIKENSDQV